MYSRIILTLAFVVFTATRIFANDQDMGPIENVGGFVEGTLVQTFGGADTIQNIRVNDRLLSFCTETGSVVENRVTGVYKFQVDQIIKLVIAGETFYLNPEHRFYVPKTDEWVAANELDTNTVLLNKNGNHLTVEEIEVIDGREWLFELTVEGTKNYFVGRNQVLVHNFAFVIPVATWVIGEGIIWATAATVAVTVGAAVAVNEMSKGSDSKQNTVRYEAGQKIDLDRFSDRQSQSGQRGVLRDPKTGESLERDRGNNPHGGSHWKLKDKKGRRVATISKDGTVLRD